MKTKKLTPYQRSILKRFQDGEYVHRGVLTGWEPASFFFQDNPHESIRRSAVIGLLRRGLIEDIVPEEDRWLGSTYRVTPAGKEFTEVERG